MQVSARFCAYCNFHQCSLSKSNIYLQVRNSMTAKPNDISVRSSVKKKQKKRKYVEHVEVSHSVKTKQATVQKLNPTDVAILADKPGITIGKLNKLRMALRREMKQARTSDSPEKPVLLETKKMILQNFEITAKTNNQLLHKFRKKPDSADTPLKLQDLRYKWTTRQENAMQSTKFKQMQLDATVQYAISYVEICLLLNKVDLAMKTLELIRLEKIEHSLNSSYINELFNMLLGYFAKQPDLNGMFEMYTILKNDDIQPNHETFAILIEGVERKQPEPDTVARLHHILRTDLDEYKVTLNDVLVKSKFIRGQADVVKRGIQRFDPDFKPVYTYPVEIPNTNSELSASIYMDSSAEGRHEGLGSLFDVSELENCMKYQLGLEHKQKIALDTVDVVSSSRTPEEEIFENLLKDWRQQLLTKFTLHRNILKKRELSTNTIVQMHPYLEILTDEEYVSIMLDSILDLLDHYKGYVPSLGYLSVRLGDLIQRRFLTRQLEVTGGLDSLIEIYKQYLNWYLCGSLKEKSLAGFLNHRLVWRHLEFLAKKEGKLVHCVKRKWQPMHLSKLGLFLIRILVNDLRLNASLLPKGMLIKDHVRVFYTLMTIENTYYREQIKPHPIVANIFSKIPQRQIRFNVEDIPPVCPPRPWVSLEQGVMFKWAPPFIRISDSLYAINYEKTCPPEKFHTTMDAVNELSAIPWAINTEILDLILEVFRNGGSKELNVPIIYPKDPTTRIEGNELEARLQRRNQLKIHSESYSLWCEGLYKFTIANHLRNKVFWIPQNIDFRGRCYSIPPNLSHLGGDIYRSLLTFAHKKPLGPKGLDWLKLHLINLVGNMKTRSIADRITYCNTILDLVKDSAEKPLTGKMWWAKAEEQWQALAMCMELNKALNAPNPEEYETGIPIHQDGSCNGLQHYAALGRDMAGAKSVNLQPSSTPQDVYIHIAEMIEKHRANDARNGMAIAITLNGHIHRKVVKQTIMTTVYGVTKFGAWRQIEKQLIDRGLSQEDASKGSEYLTKLTMSYLESMFENAKQIKDWLMGIANYISVDFKEQVQWNTPLGMPVTQPYVKNTTACDPYFSKDDRRLACKVDSRKQRNAFAPNFVHSLDSTHMMLTALTCAQRNIMFIAVHDCYWTHPCTVDEMNKICREQFIRLYTQPILNNLAKDFKRQLDEWMQMPNKDVQQRSVDGFLKHLSKVPKSGAFDINTVRDSIYFFS